MSKITLGDFLNNFARKAGIPADNPALKDVLSMTDLVGKEVNRDLYDALDRALMTQEAAVSHPEVRKKLKGETLNGADALLDRLFPELELDDAFVNELKGNKNTFERIEKTVRKLQDLRKQSAGSSGKKKEEIEKEIEKLNGDLRGLKETHKKEIEKLQGDHSSETNALRLQIMLAGKKLALPDEMDPELKTSTALAAIDRKAKSLGLKIVSDNGVLAIRREDGTKYFDEGNREVALTDFIDGALAQNKLLVVTDPGQLNPNPPVPPVPGGPGVPTNTGVVAEISNIIAESGGFKTTP